MSAASTSDSNLHLKLWMVSNYHLTQRQLFSRRKTGLSLYGLIPCHQAPPFFRCPLLLVIPQLPFRSEARNSAFGGEKKSTGLSPRHSGNRQRPRHGEKKSGDLLRPCAAVRNLILRQKSTGQPTAPVMTRYRCFLPDLAGLAGLRRVGPGTTVVYHRPAGCASRPACYSGQSKYVPAFR